MAATAKVFRVFVSSTFSDMVAERNALQSHVFPELRKLCAKNGARFQPIDLRWGISAEATLNHRATDVCLREIERCQKVTKRPNFLLLLGNRYGWRPLPDAIPVHEWIELFPFLSTDSQVLFQQWYWRDDNALPARYILQPRIGKFVNQENWNNIEVQLRDGLLAALENLPWGYKQRLKYVSSVTEQEIVAGIFNNPDASQSAFCFFRTIIDLPSKASQFIDADRQSQVQLAELKQRLHGYIPNNIHEYHTEWQSDGIHGGHLDQLCKDVEESLSTAILEELAFTEKVSPLEQERNSHYVFMGQHTQNFVGRTSVLDTLKQYINNVETVPLVLFGQSGIGKSTVMAQATRNVPNSLYRFIGITPNSADIRTLLISLCEDIAARYGVTDAVPQDYEDLIKAFPDFLAKAYPDAPLVIFLDALDQLSTTNSPNNLRWLPDTLPPHVKLVVSVIPSRIFDALKRRYPTEAILEIAPMHLNEAEQLLDLWLNVAGRTLQPEQRTQILSKFSLSGLPLYLELAFEEAKLWHSYTQDIHLYPDVLSLLRDNLFARLCRKSEHGEMLVSRSMSYISASRNGLSEEEVLEVLARDDDYWTAFISSAFHTPLGRQVPIAVWSRLSFDLAPYLIERSIDNDTLVTFYHRQFSEAVDALYLAKSRETRHTYLARYFSEQALYKDGIPNARKLSEQAYQHASAGQHEAYVADLVDYVFLKASVDVRGVESLIEDCGLRQDKTVGLIQSALRLSVSVLNVESIALAHQLVGRLMAHHQNNTEISLLTNSIPALQPGLFPVDFGSMYATHIQAGELLLRTMSGHTDPVFGVIELSDGRLLSWAGVHGYRVDDHSLRLWDANGQLIATLKGHTAMVGGVIELTDGRLLSWAGEYGHQVDDHSLRLWDANGQLIATLKGHTAMVGGVIELTDGRLLSWSRDKTLRLWTADGQSFATLEGHSDAVEDALALADGHLLSWSQDKTLRLWTADGQPLATLIGHKGYINGVRELTDGRLLSWSQDKTLRLWTADGQPLATLIEHTHSVNGTLELSNGRLLSWSRETLQLWTTNGQPLAALVGHTNYVDGVLELTDGRLLSWNQDKTLRLWDANGKACATLIGHTDTVNGALELTDGRLLSWSQDKTLRLWDANGKACATLIGHIDTVNGALELSDRRLVSWSQDKTLRLWNAGEQPSSSLFGHTYSVEGLLVLTNGHLLSWTGGLKTNDMTLRLWNADGQPLTNLVGHTSQVNGAHELTDGRLLSWSSDHTLRLWNADGQPLTNLVGHTSQVNGAHELTDGRLLSWSWDNTLRLWNSDGQPITTLVGHTSLVNGGLELSNGRLLSWSSDHTLRLWSTNGQPITTLAGHTYSVKGLLVLTDGRFLSWTGGYQNEDHTLRLWGADGQPLSVLTGHTGGVRGASELSDGRLLSWCGHGTLRLWGADGQPLSVLTGHTSGVSGASELSDGRLLSWSVDHTLRLWTADGASLDVLNEDYFSGNREVISLWAHRHYIDFDLLFTHELCSNRGCVQRVNNVLTLYNPHDGKTIAGFWGDANFNRATGLRDRITIAVGDNVGRVLFLRYLPDSGVM